MTVNDGEFVLDNSNYYSQEANRRYMSVHQYLSYAGHLGIYGCEAKAQAELNGDYVQPTTDAMLIGSYVDSYFEGTLDDFKKEHPELFTQKEKKLYAKYDVAERMIKRIEQDDYFMSTLSGEKQVIMTGFWGGCDWKIKMDSYIPGKAIVDLKTSSDIHKTWKVQDFGYCGFIDYWGYTNQLALYQKIVEINTGKKLPCYISVVTKEASPDIAVLYIDQTSLDHALNEIEMNLPSVLAVKNGEVEPIRCERCDWCKATKKLTGAINYMDLVIGE